MYGYNISSITANTIVWNVLKKERQNKEAIPHSSKPALTVGIGRIDQYHKAERDAQLSHKRFETKINLTK